jgi:Arc/MetJ-type ribon-helix-helix transcriptional regulator
MGQTSLRLPDELEEEIEQELSYGDSKSEWIREAIRIRQQVDPILDEMYESYQREERVDLMTAAVRKEVDRRKQEVNDGNNSDH